MMLHGLQFSLSLLRFFSDAALYFYALSHVYLHRLSRIRRMKPEKVHSPLLFSAEEEDSSSGDMWAALHEVQVLIGYPFKKVDLLEEALTHSSYPDYPSYQRLEFVGDAALGLAITNFLYLSNPDVGPGRLSALRAANISTEKLARVALRHDLYRFLRRNSPNLDVMVGEFSLAVATEEAPEDKFVYGVPYGGSSIKAPKVLADIVESIAAAVYIDCNFDLEKLWKVFRGLLEPIITEETLHDQPITILYEFCQKHGMTLEFKNWKKDLKNITNVFVDGHLLGIGCSEQKNIAKLNAARDALLKLVAEEPDDMESDSIIPMLDEAKQAEGAKQRLNELCTKRHWPKPFYRIENEEGPAHEKKFSCAVQVRTSTGPFETSGDLKSRIKDAENDAAFKMIACLLDMSIIGK